MTPSRILDAALALLEERGLAALTMRALARRLGADPMAVYHYYRDKNALLEAAAERAFAALRPRLPVRGSWRAKLHALARAYLRFLHRSGELLRFVVASPRASTRASPRFDELFFAIVAPLKLPKRHAMASRDALVDQLHGCSLASESYDPTAALDVLFAGMATYGATSSRRSL